MFSPKRSAGMERKMEPRCGAWIAIVVYSKGIRCRRTSAAQRRGIIVRVIVTEEGCEDGDDEPGGRLLIA